MVENNTNEVLSPPISQQMSQIFSQPVDIPNSNPVPDINGEIRGSDIYPVSRIEKLAVHRRGRPATSKSSIRANRVEAITRFHGEGGTVRGRRVQAIASVGEDDIDDSDQFYDSDDEDFEVDLDDVVENNSSEESLVDASDNDDDGFEDNVESDYSELSDVGNNEEGDIYSSDEGDEDNPVHGMRKRKHKELFNDMYDKPFVNPIDGDIKFEEGQVFDDVESFRTALRDYAVLGGFLLERKKNDKERVTAQCKRDNCTWRIHASRLQDNITFMVKKLYDVHSCVRPVENSNPNARTKWIGSKLKVLLDKDPNCTYESMEAILSKEWSLEPPRWKLYRARNMAREGVDGTHTESYMKLNRWIMDIKRSNPGTCIKLEYQPRENLDDAPQFKRIFVCFEGTKIGFLKGCRPFIGMDGCHLKGPFGGVLLAALAMDGNKGILPLAIAIVETECNSSWGFFLESLKSCIGDANEDIPYTFMSDRQKGIIDAVHNVFPMANHRHCARHIWMNFKGKFPGIGLRNEFWQAVKAESGFEFWAVMRSIREKLEGKPHAWLLELPLSQWSRHAYWPESKSEHISNNMSESFNSWILKIRDLPIVPLLDAYRKKCMVRLHKRYVKGCTMEGRLVPEAKVAINKVIRLARRCRLLPGRNDEFEVKDVNGGRFAVSMGNRKCSCKWWDISGIPCKHAALSIGYKRENIEDYVHEYFTVARYIKAYEGIIHPVPDYDNIIGDELQQIQPPPLKRLPGRPRKARRRQEGEERASATRTRFCTVKCGNCKQLGHNMKTCIRAPQDQRAPTYSSSQPVARTSNISGTADAGASISMFSQPSFSSQPTSSSRNGAEYSRGSTTGSRGGRGRGSTIGSRGGRGRGSTIGSRGGRARGSTTESRRGRGTTTGSRKARGRGKENEA